MNRDLKVAGKPKRDDRGRTVDFHALRTSFGTLLSKGGVSPRTAQQAMRHSDIGLTMTVYTDPRLLDVAGAVEVLPSFTLSVSPTLPETDSMKATGTDDRQSFVAQTVANKSDFAAHELAIPDNLGSLASIDAKAQKKPKPQ